MAHTLEFRSVQNQAQQNQAQQESLNEKFSRQCDRAMQKAILWIARQESETAAALVGREADLVFQELCRIYDAKPWEKVDNDLILNSMWLPEIVCIQSVLVELGLANILFIIGISPAVLLLMGIILTALGLLPPSITLSIVISIGITLYILSLIIRVILKVYVVQKNLVWYAPICSFFQFQKRFEADITKLKEEEQRLQEVIKKIDVWESERDLKIFKDDGGKEFDERLAQAEKKKPR